MAVNQYFRKGQIQVGVTMLVLVVFMVLLIISVGIYFRFTYQEIREGEQEILDEKFSGLLDVLVNLPELRYSLDGVEKNYLDEVKLNNFKSVASESLGRRDYYGNILNNVNAIWIEIIEVDGGIVVSGDIIDVYGVKTKGLIYSSPVSVYDPLDDKFKIGVLNIQAI